MRQSQLIIHVVLAMGISGCQAAKTPVEACPLCTAGYPTMPEFPPERSRTPRPTWTPEPTATPTLTPTPTITPTPLPSVEAYYQVYDQELSTLVAKLKIAPSSPADLTLPAEENRHIQFVPMDERLYYVQTLLFPDYVVGDASTPNTLLVAYSYGRSGCLGLFGMTCQFQGVDVTILLLVEKDDSWYLFDKSVTKAGGSGAPTSRVIPLYAVSLMRSLGGQAKTVEEILEIIISFAAGTDLVESAGSYVRPDVQTRVAILRQSLQSEYWTDREKAADSLAEIGPDAAAAVPELIVALTDEEGRVSSSAIHALSQIGPAAADAIPTLTNLLGDERFSDSHDGIIYALTKIGSAEEVLPTLLAALKDPDDDVRSTAVGALGEYGNVSSKIVEEVLAALVGALKDPDVEVRKTAVEALGKYGTVAAQIVKYLTPLLNDEVLDVREATVKALGNIGPAAPESIPALISALENESNANFQCTIIISLENFGPQAAPAVPALMRILDVGEKCISMTLDLLGNIGPAAAEAVSTITPYLMKGEYLSHTAIKALAKMGPSAMQAVPALIDLLRLGNGTESRTTLEALTAITGQDLGEQPGAWQTWWDTNKP
jgi:HEAT repeat protein